MSELKLTDDGKLGPADFDRLVNQKKLTNAETAKVLRAMVRVQRQINDNEISIQKQIMALGERMQRLESMVLDSPKPGGGVKPGLGRSLQATQKELQVVEAKMTKLHLAQATMQQLVPWLFAEIQEGNEVTPERIGEAYRKIYDRLFEEGEKAAKAYPIAEDVGRRQFRCAGCKHWRDAPAVQVPGQEVTAGCTQKAVQVLCPRCGRLHGPPVDPMDIKGECAKCKTKLVREITENDETRTLCKQFRPDIEKLRTALREADVPESLIEQVAPLPTSAAPAP